MSLVMIALNVGFGPGYLHAVIISWILGAIVSFPTTLVVVPPCDPLARATPDTYGRNTAVRRISGCLSNSNAYQCPT